MPATFNYPYHRVSTRYPVEGTNLKLGGSWSFNSKPSAPAQRSFELAFAAPKYFGVAGNLELVSSPEINFGHLEDFYQTHKLHTEFTYHHPIYGALTVKFQKPIEIPMGAIDGGGAVKGITLTLLEQPT